MGTTGTSWGARAEQRTRGVWRVTGNEVSPPTPVELGYPFLAVSNAISGLG
jgi:hypothetical protein